MTDIPPPPKFIKSSLKSYSTQPRSFVFPNRIFTFGNGAFGQLSQESKNKYFTPQPIPHNLPEQICQLECGETNTFFITRDNECFATGSNQYKQLGLAHSKDVFKFEKVGKNIKAVSAGYFHTMFHTVEDKMFGCGMTALGKLVQSSKENEVFPQQVKIVACGAYHTIIVTSTQ